MAGGSIHDKLGRVRKPRVHISYEVETGGAAVQKELPFVVGVIGDFSGNPSTPLKPLKDRKFVQIDRDNFDEVMATVSPELNLKVQNTIKGDGSEMAVQLKFRSMDDFAPGAVVNQVEPLKKLKEVRDKLTDLLAKADRSEDLEEILEKTLKSDEQLKKLGESLGIKPDGQPS
jgi:type VI secretion system protein ImpB